MKKRNKIILIFLILGFGNSFGQNDPEAKPIDTNGRVIPPPFNTWEVEPLEIHWLDRIDDSDKYINWSTEKVQYHSSILPMIPHHTGKNIVHHAAHVPHGPLQLTFHLKNRNKIELPLNGLRIYPIFDLDLGVNLQSAGVNGLFTLGAGAALDFRTNHWYFTAKLLPYTTDAPYVAVSIQKNLSMDVGTTRPISGWVFQRSEIMAVYRPHRFFSFIGGYGKNFFGDGYRSLLLSDNASAYPYLKVETSFGTIKYVNLYNVWNDNSINPANRGLDKMKFSAMHYLSWNVTKEFNISVFETVIWQYEDSLVNRGFDLNYLNPVVFYRPVEYGQGSADNVLLGLNTSVKLYGGHCIYGQMILDEFLLSELRARSRWWGNKFGFQLGYKTNSLMKKQLYMQTEFNVVRPFTYAHGSSTLSYGHLNASVAHPLGSNFYEVLNILSYQKKHEDPAESKGMRITNKLSWASFGIDTSATSYGQNIFASYSNRDGEYDHKIMQGLRVNVLNENLILEVPIVKAIKLYANFRYNYRMSWNEFGTEHQHYFIFGLRSRIWNKYTDY